MIDEYMTVQTLQLPPGYEENPELGILINGQVIQSWEMFDTHAEALALAAELAREIGASVLEWEDAG